MTHRVVVLGAGYAGLVAAKRIARQVYPDEVSVTLVTAFPDFVERPRLHQIATGQSIPQAPIAGFLRGSEIELVIASATGIDLNNQAVTITGNAGSEQLTYDTLVYALGSNIDLSRVPGVAAYAESLVGTDAAARVRSRLATLTDQGGQVVVCGGGLTGIEIAAEVAEHFPTLELSLVSAREPGDWLSPRARDYIAGAFDDLGVTVRSNARVRQVQAGELTVDDSTIGFDLCLWAGGFQVPAVARDSGLAVNAEGRALVGPSLESISHPGVYVVGDAAAVPGPWGDELAMGCRSGGFTGPKVADNIVAKLTGRPLEPFRYRYVHECISLGRKHGLVQFLHADQTPTSRILTGRKAIAYKNATLNGAKALFRNPGPVLARRHHSTGPGHRTGSNRPRVASR